MKNLPSRDGYGKKLLKLAQQNDKLIVLYADVSKSTRIHWVNMNYPEKFRKLGISKQDMVGMAAGLSLTGMLPFATTYGVFMTGRAFDKIRTTLCYGKLDVKLAGAHAGISVGSDGATHQSLEDVALMRVLPHMTVVVPCDALETEKATLAIAAHQGPCFIRFGREATPLVTQKDTPFELGKARLVRQGQEVVIFANGALVFSAMQAAKQLAQMGIDAMVVDLHRVKPIDESFILAAAQQTKAVVTAEEHQRIGGLGSAISEYLSEIFPIPVVKVGVDDPFGESGQPNELMQQYGLTEESIIKAVHRAIFLKKSRQ